MNKFHPARHGIMDMAAYVPGKPVEEVQREYGLTNVIKLASNENPLHTSKKALDAMHAELDKVFMYPEGSSPTVRDAVAKLYGIPANCVYVTNGGDHGIVLICEAFVNEDDEVIVGDPSFMTYESGTEIMGGNLVRVPLKDRKFDLNAILKAVTDKTKLIFLCNPNNPTGTIFTKDELAAFMKAVPERCIVIIDEAYFEFVTDPEYPHGLDYVKEGKNVIVLHTFSKVYGLAGLRIGYLMTTPQLMEPLMRVMPPFPVNRIAQVGAVTALTDKEFNDEVVRVNAEGREYFYKEFARLGMDCAKSQGNYVFVDIGMPCKEVCNALLKRGIIVRGAVQWGFPTSLRVTVGTMDENKAFIAALEAIQAAYRKGEAL